MTADGLGHGPDGAFYFNSFDSGYKPSLVCLCGWESSGSVDTWEAAGRELDEHLAEVE